MKLPVYKKLIFSFIPAIIIILLFELSLRLFYTPKTSPWVRQFVNPEWKEQEYFNDHPRYFWIFKPNEVVAAKGSKDFKKVKTNNLGFKGEDWKPKDIDKRLRILLLGDSCVFGWSAKGINIADRLMAHIPDNPYIFQGGVPGYSSFQIRQVFNDWAYEVKPHYVIIYIGHNDIIPCIGKRDIEIHASDINYWNRSRMLRLSYIYAFIQDMTYAKRVDKTRVNVSRLDWANGPFRVSPQESRENIEHIVKKTLEANAIPIIMTRQDAGEIVQRKITSEDGKSLTMKNTKPGLEEDLPISKYNDMLIDIASQWGIPVLEIHELAKKEDVAKFFYNPPFDHIHPSDYGYEKIAEWLIPYIDPKEKSRELHWKKE
jgi:lysophospholipase L1-like esterase